LAFDLGNKIYSKIVLGCCFGFLLIMISFPAFAAGLVPCGGQGEPDCQPCHIFAGFSNVINFIVFQLTPAAAAVMILASGVVLLFGGSESARTMGKKMFTSAIIGLIIVYSSWLIVNTIITTLARGADGGIMTTWWQVRCN
jgi:hypothetical protein